MTRNEKIINGLDQIIKGAMSVKEALTGVDTTADVEKSTRGHTVARTANSTPAAEETVETVEVADGEITRESLLAMKYNDMKKLGASLGVPCSGKRDEIIDRILEKVNGGDVPKAEEPDEEEETPAPKKEKKSGGLKKKAEESVEIPDEILAQAEEATEGMTAKEIIEYLADFDIEASGKKSDVVKVLAKAIMDGVVELEDDEAEEEETAEDNTEEAEVESVEESDEEESEDEEGEEIEVDADTYFSDYDLSGLNNPDNMTDARKDAIHTMMEEIISMVDTENMTEDDMVAFLENFATQEEIDLLGDEYSFEELFALYCEKRKHMIDDDGEEHEGSDPYTINDENVCCGSVLKYNKRSKKYVCEKCGQTYEAE